MVGDGAITYALVAGSFHFINRIADLLHVDPEALPEGLRRFEFLRRLGVQVAARLFRGVDLANRPYGGTYEQALGAFKAALEPSMGRPLDQQLSVLRARPHAIDILHLAVEERDRRSSLSRGVIARVQQGVEDALPARSEDSQGLHARPRDPVDAFVFVGTRYAARTTRKMIDALREGGFDDLGVLDLAIAVADANQWARMHRLLGVDPGLFYLDALSASRVEAMET